jgi:formate hydrogenlyase transcriptional activator
VVQFDAIAQYDEAANKVHWHETEACRPSSATHAPIRKEETLAWWVYQHQQPLLIRRVDSDARFPAMMAQRRAHGMQSICALPLSTAHRQLGSILIASRRPDAYAEDEMGFFLLRTTAASIRQVMQCDAVGFALPDANGRLQVYALDFPDGRGVIKEGYSSPPPHSETGAEYVLRTGKPLNRRAVDLVDELEAVAEGAKALCHLPLAGRDRVLGVVTLGRRDDEPFSDDEFRVSWPGCETSRDRG